MTTILIKKKDTAGAPAAGDLTNAAGGAEIAVNTATKRLYSKDSGGNVIELGTNATAMTVTSLTDSGNLTFTGTGNRITGDFSNSTLASRVLFQSSTTNGASGVIAIPNGTGVIASWSAQNSSDVANGANIAIRASDTDMSVRSGIVGTGTYLPMTFYTGGSESVRIDTSGNVGIGASIPATLAQLTVYGTGQTTAAMSTSSGLGGTLYVRDSAVAAGNGGAVIFGAGQGSFAAIKGLLTNGSTNTIGDLAFSTRNANADAALTERMRILSGGNVGIGTSSPAVKLDVTGIAGWSGNTTGQTAQIVGASSGIAGGGNFRVLSNTTQAVDVGGALTLGGYYATTATSVDFASILGAKENSTGGNTAGYLAFGTRVNAGNTTERMRIDSSGNVGIGTVSPSAFGAKLAIYSAASSTANIQITNPGVGTGTIGIAAASGNFKIYNSYASGTLASGVGIDIDTSGNVGIGTNAPASKLSVVGAISSTSQISASTGVIGVTTTSGAFGLRAAADSADTYASIQFTNYAQNTAWSYVRSYGSNKVSILDSTGSSSVNVGIGTTTPDASFSLDTTGTIRSRSNIYAGFVSGSQAGIWLSRNDYSSPAIQGLTSAGNAGTLLINPAAGAVCIGTNGGAIRSINLNANEISIAQASTTCFWNWSDGSGNNGANYSINFRGLATGGAAQTNLSSFSILATSGGINGSWSKGSGSFRIDHPLPSMSETHHLVHSFIEGPRIDLIYRGEVTLVNGAAVVNIDQEATMTEGTFEALCREAQCFTTNETDWDAVKGSVSGNLLTITCQNPASTAKISWMVIAERKDKHIMDTNWTDSNGKVIVEPLKPEPVEGDLPLEGA
jgi:hypothetical protein